MHSAAKSHAALAVAPSAPEGRSADTDAIQKIELLVEDQGRLLRQVAADVREVREWTGSKDEAASAQRAIERMRLSGRPLRRAREQLEAATALDDGPRMASLIGLRLDLEYCRIVGRFCGATSPG